MRKVGSACKFSRIQSNLRTPHGRLRRTLGLVPRPCLHTFVLVLEDGTAATPPRFTSTEPGWQAGDEIVVVDHFFDVVEAVRHVDRGVYATLIVRPK